MKTEQTSIDQEAAKRFLLVMEYLKKKYDISSQTELAKACGVTQGMIGHIVNGRRAVPFDMMKLLYIRYGILPTFIVAGAGPMSTSEDGKTLVTDTRELRAEIEVLSARMKKMEQDMRILSQKTA